MRVPDLPPMVTLSVDEGDHGPDPVGRVPVAVSTPVGGLGGQCVTFLREVDGQFLQLPIRQVTQYVCEVPAAPFQVVDRLGHEAEVT